MNAYQSRAPFVVEASAEDAGRVFAALAGALLEAGLDALAQWAQQITSAESPLLDPAVEAAALLGVELDASPDEIRRALRAKLTATAAHPDHGGDCEEASRLIAARNLLVERARTLNTHAGGAT